MLVFKQFQHFQTNLQLDASTVFATCQEVNLLPTRAVKKFRFDSYSSLLSNSILSGLTEVFLHVRCIPHQ